MTMQQETTESREYWLPREGARICKEVVTPLRLGTCIFSYLYKCFSTLSLYLVRSAFPTPAFTEWQRTHWGKITHWNCCLVVSEATKKNFLHVNRFWSLIIVFQCKLMMVDSPLKTYIQKNDFPIILFINYKSDEQPHALWTIFHITSEIL